MLYVTTRNKADTYTANHALTEPRGSDGGFYVPFHVPQLNREVLCHQSANETIAEVLNCFFPGQLTGRDVDLAIGKFPVRLNSMNHRISVVESWHNLDWDFTRMVKNLTARICGTRKTERPYGTWAEIAIRIAVIFGAFSTALRQQSLTFDDGFDIVVPSSDFSGAVSAWYCREMGLPIHNIVIACNENNNLWELFNHGEMRSGRVAVSTTTPDCDKTIPELLEIIIYLCGGADEVEYFLDCCRRGKTYYLSEDISTRLQQRIYVSVIGQTRMETTISGAFGTHNYVFGPYSALSYAGLLDYRARTGENHHALLLSEKGALLHDGFVAQSMGITVEQLHKILE